MGTGGRYDVMETGKGRQKFTMPVGKGRKNMEGNKKVRKKTNKVE